MTDRAPPVPGVARVRIPTTLIGILRESARLVRDPALLLWCLYLCLIPYYVFYSGLPQPGDMLVLFLVPVALRAWNGRLDRSQRRPLSTLIAFSLWVLLINWGWAVLVGNFALFGPDTFVVFPMYYLYNTMVFLVVCVLYQRFGIRFLWLTLHVVFFTVLVQGALSLVMHRGGLRGALFFNNPNQLGFFALVCASLIALGKRALGFGAFKSGVSLTACCYLALLSASRAAVIGCAMLLAFTLIANPKQIAVVAVVILGFAAVGGPLIDAFGQTQERLTVDRYPHLTFFEERGYDRILAHKEYWLLGAGEGGTSRFADTTLIGASEIHSSAGTLFFCYGIVGVAIFLGFLFRVAEGAPLTTKLILIPTLAYTVAHQGLRSTPLWILFAVFVCVKHLQRANAARRVAPAPVSLRPALHGGMR
jgi:hypothetical protein